MSGDTYTTVVCELVRVNPRSFIVLNGDGEEVVVDRSCVHGVDEQEVAQHNEGDEVQFRVMRWLAEKHGL